MGKMRLIVRSFHNGLEFISFALLKGAKVRDYLLLLDCVLFAFFLGD